jgi:hypothetical protein
MGRNNKIGLKKRKNLKGTIVKKIALAQVERLTFLNRHLDTIMAKEHTEPKLKIFIKMQSLARFFKR